MTVTIINSCEVCDGNMLVPVLDLKLHPLCDDLVKIGENRECKQYPISILYCPTCKTAHQEHPVPKHELFKFDYHYRARMTGSVLRGMADLVKSISDHVGPLEGKAVLDIGCNDGSLLSIFKKVGAKTIGVEPTSAAHDSEHETYNDFFDTPLAYKILKDHGKFDIITFTNVFAHIEDLNGLLEAVNIVLKPAGQLIIENHYLGAVLDTNQFDTFYHEHPRTYSEESFRAIAAKLDRNVTKVEYVSRYGGNIRAYIGLGEPAAKQKLENDFEDKFATMRLDLVNWMSDKKGEILSLNEKYGPITAKAFPGRAAILVKLLELDETNISAVYEIKGSIKVDHFVPGTRIPILAEKQLYAQGNQPPVILNLAWHIAAEVEANLKKNKVSSPIINIKEML